MTSQAVARKVVGAVLLTVGALLSAAGVLLAYGLTSEYGASPNDDLWTDLRTTLISGLTLLLAVGALCWLGLLGVAPARGRRQRGTLTAAVAVVTAIAFVAAIALGQRALHERCDRDGASSSAACPGFTGPPVTPAS